MKKRDEAFPWDAVMRFGFGILKLSPKDFWAMTPIELASAMRAHGFYGSKPMVRSAFEEMMTAFPDQTADQDIRKKHER